MTADLPFVVIGAGGHAKVILSVLRANGREVVAVLDDDPGKHGHHVLGSKVIGPIEVISQMNHVQGVIAIGDNSVRRDLAMQYQDVKWGVAVHPSAVVHASATLGAGSVIFAGAIVQPETAIGRHSIVNTSASVDHDCRIDDFVHVGPGARLAGAVEIGAGTLLGVGSTVTPGVSIGEWAVLGAGSVALSDIPAHQTAVGLPAAPIRGYGAA